MGGFPKGERFVNVGTPEDCGRIRVEMFKERNVGILDHVTRQGSQIFFLQNSEGCQLSVRYLVRVDGVVNSEREKKKNWSNNCVNFIFGVFYQFNFLIIKMKG